MRFTRLAKMILIAIATLFLTPGMASPPASSGPLVIRGQNFLAMTMADPDTGLLSVLGADPVEFCSGIQDFDLFSFMTVNVPNDVNRIKGLAGGEVQASVWDFTEFRCDFFLALQPLASGMASIILTDNDLNLSGGNANAFGHNAHGTLWTPSGEAVQYNELFHAVFVFQKNGPTFKSIVSIDLH